MIEVTDLGVSLSGKAILEGYSLRVAKGEVLAILGANGVGKTTLMHCLAGLRRPDRGTANRQGHIGFVPQLFQATFAFSVLDIVLMGRARRLGLFGAPRRVDFEIAAHHLDLLQIAHLRDRPFNALSGGQRQLTIIAQALTSECETLVLDEPCSALDYKNQAIVIAVLQRLNRELGLTIVFSTHVPQHALEIASHALLMQDRQLYRLGPVAEVLTAEHLSDLYGISIARAEFAAHGAFTFAPALTQPTS
jgi:iron complex transport system ATP-binding protein